MLGIDLIVTQCLQHKIQKVAATGFYKILIPCRHSKLKSNDESIFILPNISYMMCYPQDQQ